ncbi:ABC transporter permease [Palleronia sp. LCG004]|uniref:ABC transporter permease n=1 Tax=Palleronia sp. LCG004 TaxID=3079304 RepID=UPI002942ABAC|nr:ABC transporter permease [Palleronia sp. LCG004]WOI56583.1 ABC transporter permease [Palleronia sp. LCG004]
MRKPFFVYAILFLVVLYLPVALLPLFSLNASVNPSFPLSGFTFEWYEDLARQSAMFEALKNSLIVGVTAAAVSTTLGMLVALATVRHRFPGMAPVNALIMSPLVLPQILLAVSLMILALQTGIGLSLMTVTAGHILLCTPFTTVVLRASCGGMDGSLEEASYDLGYSPFATFLHVTLPLLAPGLVASFLIAFTLSFDEFIVAFFLSGSEPTLPLYIWGQLRFPQRLPAILALGTIILFSSVMLLLLALRLLGRSSAGKDLDLS